MNYSCSLNVEKSAEDHEMLVAATSETNDKRQSIKQDKAVKPHKPEKLPKPADLPQAAGALYGNVERGMNTEVKVADLSKYVNERRLDEGFRKEYTVSVSENGLLVLAVLYRWGIDARRLEWIFEIWCSSTREFN